MIKIQFANKTLTIPSEWSDIKLGDYEQWFNHKPTNSEAYVRLICNICKMDVNMILESPPQLFDTIDGIAKFVFDTDMPPSQHVRIKGKKHFVSLSDKLTLGEWVDIDSVLDSDSSCKISEILAIVCRPKGESYDAQLTERRKLIFRNMSCEKVLPLLAFFLHKKREYEETLSLYSNMSGLANQFLKDTKSLVKSGDGTKQLPIWQRIRY